jgi:hypothetical protein
VEFLADSLADCWRRIMDAATTCDAVALTPSLFDIAPAELERKKVQVGYAELATHTGTIRQLIMEGRIIHTGEQMLAEHVDRAGGRPYSTRLRALVTKEQRPDHPGALPGVRDVTGGAAGTAVKACYRVRLVA